MYTADIMVIQYMAVEEDKQQMMMARQEGCRTSSSLDRDAVIAWNHEGDTCTEAIKRSASCDTFALDLSLWLMEQREVLIYACSLLSCPSRSQATCHQAYYQENIKI
jgi:hypothetical protein